MKKAIKTFLAASVVLGALTVGLTGCNGPQNPGVGDRWYASDVHLPDGSQVTCVAAGGGGVTCDWDQRTQK